MIDSGSHVEHCATSYGLNGITVTSLDQRHVILQHYSASSSTFRSSHASTQPHLRHGNSLHHILLHRSTRTPSVCSQTSHRLPSRNTPSSHGLLSQLAPTSRRNLSPVFWCQRTYSTSHLGKSDGNERYVSKPFSNTSPLCCATYLLMLWDSDLAVFNIMTSLSNGNKSASVQTTCHAGTHRSVAAAEIIAQKLRSLGVHDVRIMHAHRQRKPGDLI
jgi:hypothetical protein